MKSPVNWTVPNLLIVGLLVVVILLLGVNLFRGGLGRGSAQDLKAMNPESDPYIVNQVKNTIIKGSSEIRKCYNDFLLTNTTTTDGKVMIDWTILADGRVSRPELVSSELASPTLETCVVNVVAAMQFPPPPGGEPHYVAHKFLFKKDQ